MDHLPIRNAPDDEGPGTAEPGLVVALRRGDDWAYEHLVRHNGGRMLATARRILNDDAAAQDCVQEAFLNAFRSLERFEARSTLATWLTRITINAALMRLRSRTRRNEQSIDELGPEFDQNACRIEPHWLFPGDTDELLQRREIRELVRAKIAELPEQHRIVLMLRDIEELSTLEVAELLETTEGAVKTRLHRARAALKKLLEPLWRDGMA